MAVEFTWEQKVYIVRAFASVRTVHDIMDAVQLNYGLRCKPDDILPFDPEYRILPPDLHQVYATACKDFDENPEKLIPLLSPVKQAAALANAAQAELRRNALPAAATLLEQLAKLQGGFFASKAKGSDPKDAKATTDVHDVNPKMTAEQAAEAYASTLDGN